MFARTVSLNRCGSWKTTPIWLRSERWVIVRTSIPSIRICAIRDRMQPLQQRDERRLAAAARSHERDRLARPDGEIDVAQHRHARLVPELDAPELHLAAERRHMGRVGCRRPPVSSASRMA